MRSFFAAVAGLALCAICGPVLGFQQGDKCPDTGTEFVPEKTSGNGPKDLVCRAVGYEDSKWSCHRFVTVIPEHSKCAAGGSSPGFRCVKAGTKAHIKYKGKCGPVPEECTFSRNTADIVDENVGSTPNFKPEACEQ